VAMVKKFYIAKILFFLLFSGIIIGSSCAGSKKSSYSTRKSQTSKVSASQLGRNKYYFSTNYQKKLKKGFKK
jgi:hypothetical protein